LLEKPRRYNFIYRK